MTGLNITHVVINSITTKLQREADASRVQSLWMTARESVSMIILGPEMLISGGFRLLLGFPDFLARLCGIGVDEIHVLLSWGVGFRDAFTRIGYIREQLLDSVPLIGVTATLRVTDGVEQSVLNFLSVKHNQAHFIRRSNARYNIQYLRRTLYSGIGGDDFPELLWLLSIPSSEKVVIFCASINLGFRVKKYLNRVWTSSTDADQAIRMYNALNDDDHNTKTRDMAQHLALCYIIIATTTIALGANIMGIAYIVMIGPPESSDMFLQMAGRLDRENTVVQPRVILYVSEAHQELARKILAESPEKMIAEQLKSGKGQLSLDREAAELITCTCIPDTLDRLYNNQLTESLCSCTRCTKHPHHPKPDSCICSGCSPEVELWSPSKAASCTMAPHSGTPTPKVPHITKAMRNNIGIPRLIAFRNHCFINAPDSATSFYVHDYLPDKLITRILEDQFFATLNSICDICTLIDTVPALNPDNCQTLFDAISELRVAFDDKRRATALIARTKAAETRRKKKEAVFLASLQSESAEKQ